MSDENSKLYVFRQMQRIEYFFAVPAESWPDAKKAVQDNGFKSHHQLFKTGRTFTSQPKRVETLDITDCMLRGFTLALEDEIYCCDAQGTNEIFVEDCGFTTLINGRCAKCIQMLNDGARISAVDIAITEPYSKEELGYTKEEE
tara:strand:- start:635 stop:1066 length:432 start_codon:yes stop_codon:yes gene_type:complete